MLTLSHVYKSFGRLLAVSDLSVTLVPGRVLGLLGPNGAGKTTTIRLIMGLLVPTAGQIVGEIDGKQIGPTELAFRSYVGYCSEKPPLYPEMTVRDYLYTVCVLRQVPAAQREASVIQALQALDLVSVADRETGILSKGQRQRVNIAQSLVHDPMIWVLDEPLAGLDPEQVALVRALIHSMGRQKAVVVSSHLLSEITQMCTDILILKKGVSLLSGTLSEVMQDQSHTLHVTLRAVPDVVEAVFREAFGVCTWMVLDSQPGFYTYHIQSDRDVREALFGLCCRHQWPIYDLHMSQKPLEQLYLEVIRA